MTPEQEKQLVRLLGLTAWPLPSKVFDAALALIPTVAIEVMAFRDDKVVLLPRPANDPFWPNQMHGPGTVMRRGDTEEKALRRAVAELGKHGRVSPPQFVDRMHFLNGEGRDECRRGQEIALLFVVEYDGPLPEGAVLAHPDDLPENILSFHPLLIARAVEWRKAGR